MANTFSASSGSWGITITFSEYGTPANSNRISWSATVSAYGDSWSQDSTRFQLTIGGESINKDRTTVRNGTVLSGVTSKWFPRQNNGYLSVPFSLYFKGYNSGMSTSGTITGTYKAMYSNVGAPSQFSLYILDPHQKEGNTLEGTRYTYDSSSNSHSLTGDTTYQKDINYYIRVQNTTQLQTYGDFDSRSGWKDNPIVSDIRVVASGASAGTQNAVKGYRIYYIISDSVSLPTTSSYTGYWDTSATDTLSLAPPNIMSGKRGKYIAFRAIALGSVSGYNSGMSSYYAIIQVNDLPDAPTATAQKTTIPSGASSAVINTSYPSHNTNYSGYGVYYSTEPDLSKAAAVPTSGNYSVKNLGQGETENFYFWSWDGLEFSSSYITVPIIKNTVPTLTLSSQNPAFYTAKGKNEFYSKKIEVGIKPNKTGTITAQIYYRLYTEAETSQDYWSVGASLVFPVSSTGVTITHDFIEWFNKTGSIINIPAGKDLQLQFSYVFTDGLETASALSNICTIAGPSSSVVYYNQHDASNVEGTNGQYFSTAIRIGLQLDELVGGYMCQAVTSSETVECTLLNITKDSEYSYLDILVPTTVAGGTQISFNIIGEIKNTSNENVLTQTLSSVGSMTKIKSPSLTSVTTGMSSTLNMFDVESTAEYNFTINDFLNGENYTEVYQAYGLSSEILEAVKYYLITGSNIYDIKFKSLSKSGDFYSGVLTALSLFDWNKGSLGVITFAGIYTYQSQIQIYNLFGDVYGITLPNLKLNFNKFDPSLKASYVFQYSTTLATGTWTNFSDTQKLQKGARLRAIISNLIFYSEENITSWVETSENITSMSGKVVLDSSTLQFGNYYKVPSGSSYPDGKRNYGTDTITIDLGTIPEITSTTAAQFRAYFTGSVNSTSTYKMDLGSRAVLYQTTPSVQIKSCSINANTGTQWDLYGTAWLNCSEEYNVTYTLIKAEDETVLSPEDFSFTIDEENNTFSTSVDYTKTTDPWVSLPVKLLIKVAIKTSSNPTYLFYDEILYSSNTLIAYNITPTILYRPNKIGINVSDSDMADTERTVLIKNNAGSTGIGVVGTYGKADVLINDNTDTKITIFKLDNFVIDGGVIS